MNYEMAAKSQKQSSAQLGVGMLQHKCDKCNNKKPTLQRAAAGPSPETVPLIVHEVLRSPGQPLDASTRAFMEPRFGHDFSQVRVHTDAKAADSAKNLNARAYTAGQDIVFSGGQYSPHDAFGRRLLAHELVHVVQQSKSIFGFQPKIQRWGAEDHKKITEASIRKLMGFFEGFQMDPVALRLFLDYSTEMDRRAPELLFNIGGAAEKIPIVGLPFKRARGSLSDYYRRHQLRALNHGEGGLYSISKEEATKRNQKHQMNIFEKARKIFKRIPAHYASSIESERAKIQGRNSVLSLLGDALHIAQDRGAHGEGGAGLGHSRLGFDPDSNSKSENSTGYIEAIRNTELIILDAQDILYRLLHMNWTRTFSIIQKKEFYKKATAESGFSIESEDSFEKEADEVAESISTNAIKTAGLHSHAIPKIQEKIESRPKSREVLQVARKKGETVKVGAAYAASSRKHSVAKKDPAVCIPNRPLAWSDFKGKGKPSETVHIDYSFPLPGNQAKKLKVILNPKASVGISHYESQDCPAQIAKCKKSFKQQRVETWELGPNISCPASNRPNPLIKAKSQADCDKLIARECNRVSQLESMRILSHEQNHFNIGCILVGKANATISAGKDLYEVHGILESVVEKGNEDYDADTNHGCDPKGQSNWDAEIKKGLPNVTVK